MLLILLLALWVVLRNVLHPPPGSCGVLLHPHFTEDSFVLDRKDVLSLIAVFLLMLPDSGALRGSEAGESLLYLIHRNNVLAGAMLGPTNKGAMNGA